jgi:hypothetical protein
VRLFQEINSVFLAWYWEEDTKILKISYVWEKIQKENHMSTIYIFFCKFKYFQLKIKFIYNTNKKIFQSNSIYFNCRSSRSKRATVTPQNNLFVEYLIVIDSTVFNNFYFAYGGNLPDNLLSQYIIIFYSQLVNSVWKWFYLKHTVLLIKKIFRWINGTKILSKITQVSCSQ